MTKYQVAEGRKVRIADPFRIAVRFYVPSKGIAGTEGRYIPRHLLDMTATICDRSKDKRRVLIGWTNTTAEGVIEVLRMWLDIDAVETV